MCICDWIKLQVFIPVSNGEHNFLVVFNLKNCDIWMLDSKGVKKPVAKKGKKTVVNFPTAKKVVDGQETVADDCVATIVVCLDRFMYKCFVNICPVSNMFFFS